MTGATDIGSFFAILEHRDPLFEHLKQIFENRALILEDRLNILEDPIFIRTLQILLEVLADILELFYSEYTLHWHIFYNMLYIHFKRDESEGL